jgi:hypothetical protein
LGSYSAELLKTARDLSSNLNLHELHEDGDVGLSVPRNETPLNRACATTLPSETAEERIMTYLPLLPTSGDSA